MNSIQLSLAVCASGGILQNDGRSHSEKGEKDAGDANGVLGFRVVEDAEE